MTWIAGGHHVVGVEHLRRQIGNGCRAEGRVALRGQRGESGHEEVQAGEGDHVDAQLAEVGVQLAGESGRVKR